MELPYAMLFLMHLTFWPSVVKFRSLICYQFLTGTVLVRVDCPLHLSIQWSSGAGDVVGASVKYSRSEMAMDDGVDTDDGVDGADEAGSELRVPAGDPLGMMTAR